jgi:hypothetical protein
MINEKIKRNNGKITKKNTFTFTLAEQNKTKQTKYLLWNDNKFFYFRGSIL